jgi:hypothetical protein
MLKLPPTSTYQLLYISILTFTLPLLGQGGFNYFKEVKQLAFVTNNIPASWADSCQKFINDRPDLYDTFFYSFYDQRIIPVTIDENTPRIFINRFFVSERLDEFERLTTNGWQDWKKALREMYGRN